MARCFEHMTKTKPDGKQGIFPPAAARLPAWVGAGTGAGVPRPPCPRHLARAVPSAFFKPAGTPLYELEEVVLAADELEAVRLADCEDLYRVDAAARMKVSRPTFDRILKRARAKIAGALVKGQALRIEGRAASTPAPRGNRARGSRKISRAPG